MIIELVKKSFKNIYQNPALPLCLVFALIFSKLAMPFVASSNMAVVSAILLICFFLLCSCFLAGWFQIFKESTKEENAEDKKFFPIFLEGIGKNVFPMSIGLMIYLISSIFVIVASSFIASHIFGDLTTIMKEVFANASDSANVFELIASLSPAQKEVLYGWQICILLGIAILNFLFMFYPAILANDDKTNIVLKPFKNLIDSFCFLFKNFFKSLLLYIYIYITYIIVEALCALSSVNEILTILALFIYIYFICYALMLIFNYYEHQIQQKNSCDNGSDSIGENEAINSTSENAK